MQSTKIPAKREAKATPAAAAVSMPPIPGQIWTEHQAVYIGVMHSADGKSAWHLLLPIGAKFQIKAEWGCYRTRVPGADCRFDGHANTVAMAAAGSAVAKQAIELDCHIMSRAEGALCYAIAPEEFKTDDWYWTSTQYSEGYAWDQGFYYGDQDGNGKDYERRCRFVRRLMLQSFNPLDFSVAA
jgi:hypothetical protein